MRYLIHITILFFSFISISFAAMSIDSTGLLGDGFSLPGAIETFKSAKSLEDFENKLNIEDNYITNLDLNNDGDIDYISVHEEIVEKVHVIVLQAIINESEVQDVAVIYLEKTGDKSALLQIIGDEMLYGDDMIVEPYDVEGNSIGKGGPSVDCQLEKVVVNVWGWPLVRFVYTPQYSVYHSPFYWGHYPRRWRPWRPHSFKVHYNHRKHFRHHHRAVHIHRIPKAHKIYTPNRRSSATVHKRTTIKVKKNGTKVRKTKEVKVKKKGGKTKIKKTTVSNKKHKVTKTTKVKKKRNGKVKKTKVVRRRK